MKEGVKPSQNLAEFCSLSFTLLSSYQEPLTETNKQKKKQKATSRFSLSCPVIRATLFFFSTYDSGGPGYEFGSLARIVDCNAFAHWLADWRKTECGWG